MAFTTTMLSWGVLSYEDAYKEVGKKSCLLFIQLIVFSINKSYTNNFDDDAFLNIVLILHNSLINMRCCEEMQNDMFCIGADL